MPRFSILGRIKKSVALNESEREPKYGFKYRDKLREELGTDYIFLKVMLDIYRVKLYAFKFAKGEVLKEYPQYEENILAFFHDSKENSKSILRNKLNSYMSLYVQQIGLMGYEDIVEKYEKFHWVTMHDIKTELNKKHYAEKHEIIKKYKSILEVEQYEYKRIMQEGGCAIYDESGMDIVSKLAKKKEVKNKEKQVDIKTEKETQNKREDTALVSRQENKRADRQEYKPKNITNIQQSNSVNTNENQSKPQTDISKKREKAYSKHQSSEYKRNGIDIEI